MPLFVCHAANAQATHYVKTWTEEKHRVLHCEFVDDTTDFSVTWSRPPQGHRGGLASKRRNCA